MSAGNPQTPYLTEFRSRIRSLVESEAEATRSRHVVILGIDGIPHDLAVRSWHLARIERMRSVFPPTSSTAWLSSLSGLSVDEHGVPGVVFRVPERSDDLIHVFEHKGWLSSLKMENIFSDAAKSGYLPLSILGDLEDFDCAWRDQLLCNSRQLAGYRFFTARSESAAPLDAAMLCRRLRRAIKRSLAAHAQRLPVLLWCFIDVDRHIHRHGYDEHVVRLLGMIERLAVELAESGVRVVAHSDHGLAPTRHDPQVGRLMDRLQPDFQCSVGGAGRTRWIYPRPGTGREIIAELERHLPSSIGIHKADELFAEGSLSRGRVGDIVLIAGGEEFLAPAGYLFDHGSRTDEELYVPFAEWGSSAW